MYALCLFESMRDLQRELEGRKIQIFASHASSSERYLLDFHHNIHKYFRHIIWQEALRAEGKEKKLETQDAVQRLFMIG